MYDLIVIGGGPAGLTATIYALRRRLSVLLLTRDLGGKTNYRLQLPGIDHHLVINGEEVINRFVNEIEYLDFARRLDRVTAVERATGGFDVHTHGGRTESARALIVATGARAQRLEVPGENEYLMRGLCYSAVSYAPLFVGRSAVVVGDSELALRAAAELSLIARAVTLVAPTHGELGGAIGHRLLFAPRVTILQGYRVQRVNGDQYARSLTVTDGQLTIDIAADGFFVELGLQPSTGFLNGLVECDDQGRIRVDARNRTSVDGIFAAGDVTDVYAEQVLVAIGEGTKAVLSAHEFLLQTPVAASAEPLSVEWR